MALTGQNHRAMLKGFEQAGYVRIQDSASANNPVRLIWKVDGKEMAVRLWVFEITHGGGGSEVRAADEFRIQITNGPARAADFDTGGYIDLLFGYSPKRDAIVAYDRRWLETWTNRKEHQGGGGSPSVQVKEADIRRGIKDGIYHFTKNTQLFGQADIVTMRPGFLPGYLRNHQQVLRGQMSASQVEEQLASSAMDNIHSYCLHRGFSFPPEIIARYLASLLTKPFVILAGVSGTGKSKLAELVAEYYSRGTATELQAKVGAPAPNTGSEYVFAESMGAPDPTRFALVAVRPDWIDNQSVLGFVNPITQEYESTQALDLILRAEIALGQSKDFASAPRFFMLLDEMNLAKVEHYFSDWLACSESRRYTPDGAVAQQAIPLHRSAESLTVALSSGIEGTVLMDVPENLALPTNLVVTGTVNIDETTYGLSPKVLDRAMVLEFDEVELDRLRGESPAGSAGPGFRFPDALPEFRLPTRSDYQSIPAAAHVHLRSINSILETARLHFGYRSAAEMARFMALYNDFLPPAEEPDSDDDWLRALDIALLQKVLPRLQGNRAKLEQALVRMCLYLRDLIDDSGAQITTSFDKESPAKLPKSYRRALEMLDALRDFGFVSFFK